MASTDCFFFVLYQSTHIACVEELHRYNIKTSYTDEYPCATGIQPARATVMPNFAEQRCQTWTEPVDLREKLWGRAKSDITMATNLAI